MNVWLIGWLKETVNEWINAWNKLIGWLTEWFSDKQMVCWMVEKRDGPVGGGGGGGGDSQINMMGMIVEIVEKPPLKDTNMGVAPANFTP